MAEDAEFRKANWRTAEHGGARTDFTLNMGQGKHPYIWTFAADKQASWTCCDGLISETQGRACTRFTNINNQAALMLHYSGK